MTAAIGGGSVALAGGTIPASGSCTVTVNVTSAASGLYNNTIAAGALTTTNAGSNAAAANASLSVLAGLGVAQTFTPPTIGAGATSVLTVTLTNSNSIAITGTAFDDEYPAGLLNTAAAGAASTCAGAALTAPQRRNAPRHDRGHGAGQWLVHRDGQRHVERGRCIRQPSRDL